MWNLTQALYNTYHHTWESMHIVIKKVKVSHVWKKMVQSNYYPETERAHWRRVALEITWSYDHMFGFYGHLDEWEQTVHEMQLECLHLGHIKKCSAMTVIQCLLSFEVHFQYNKHELVQAKFNKWLQLYGNIIQPCVDLHLGVLYLDSSI